jgi:hypothetical protein
VPGRSVDVRSLRRRGLLHKAFAWFSYLTYMAAGLLVLVYSPTPITYAVVGLISALALSVIILSFRSKDPDGAFRELLRAVTRVTDLPTLPTNPDGPDERVNERSGPPPK